MNLIKSFIKRAYMKFTVQEWNVGFISEDLDDIIGGAPLKMRICRHNYRDRWFADPFILDVNDKYIYLLVEELYNKWGKGRITKLTIERNSNRIVLVEPILQLNSHLSFPAILRTGDSIFIYPENAKGYGLALYSYDHRLNDVEFVKVISSKPLADAVITEILGEKEIFATEIPTHNGNTLNQYSIGDSELSLKRQHIFSSNIARNAGDWFSLNGTTYRPAQDCNNCYGEAVILQRVTKNNGKLEFSDVRRIKSTSWKYSTGCHTFNHYKGITVVDVHGYAYPILGRLFESFTPKSLLI